MKKTTLSFLKISLLILLGSQGISNNVMAGDELTKYTNGKHRSDKNIARNEFRHPVETLKFFGIKPTMTVAEITPGGGWYTEILAPYLKDKGQYIAAGYDPDHKIKEISKYAKAFADKLVSDPEQYGKTKLSVMQTPYKLEFAPENSVDMVVSFRNAHGWGNHSGAVFSAIYKAVKPNGIFGLVQHRAGVHDPKGTGYRRQSDIIDMAIKAGFRLVAQSEINANPKDKKDYKEGVWTLPPVYRLGDKDRAKYKAIGESDRMTLKFVKPAQT